MAQPLNPRDLSIARLYLRVMELKPVTTKRKRYLMTYAQIAMCECQSRVNVVVGGDQTVFIYKTLTNRSCCRPQSRSSCELL